MLRIRMKWNLKSIEFPQNEIWNKRTSRKMKCPRKIMHGKEAKERQIQKVG
jgi:hypothetical protein